MFRRLAIQVCDVTQIVHKVQFCYHDLKDDKYRL